LHMNGFFTVLSEYWPLLVPAMLCLLCAAFCAAAETALVFANKAQLQRSSEEGSTRAKIALGLALNRDRLHGSLLLAENLLLSLAVALVAVAAFDVFGGNAAVVVATSVCMGVVIVLFAKLVPKGIAARYPEGFALLAAYPLRPIVNFIAPLAGTLARTADIIAGPTSPKSLSCTSVVTEEDIKAMINLGEEEGALKEEERELLHKIFEFGDTVASEAMRPRTEIVSVASSATVQNVLALVSEHGYSRYPVIENTVDTVTGIIYIKDLLIAMAAGEVKREESIGQFIRQAYFIPENKRVSELLAEMQRDKFQIAIVIDEFGGTAGLVTLEDLIEEIVGSIHDELEVGERDVEIVDEKNVVVSGQSEIDEVNELLDTGLQSKDFNTIGGFLFGLFGRMPRAGEQLRYKDLKFEVLELDGRKIDKIKITKL
jgi:putative hemolysin